jgi:hypothetical protein
MPEPVIPTAPAAPVEQSASEAIAAKLSTQFPDGRLPAPVNSRQLEIQRELAQSQERENARLRAEGVIPQIPTGPTGAPAPVTGPTGAPALPMSGPLAAIVGTGPTGAPTAPTGPTGAPTGPTGTPTGPAESGASGVTGPKEKLTDEEKAALEKNLPVSAGTAFKLIRKEAADNAARADAEAQRASALETRLVETESKVTDPKEIADLKAQVKQNEADLAIVRVEATKEFRDNIKIPLAKTTEQLLALAAKHNIKESDLRSALAEPDAGKRTDRLSELSTEFNRMDMTAFDRLSLDLMSLEAKRDEYLDQASERFAAQQQSQEAAARAAKDKFAKDWTSALDSSHQKLVKDFPIFGKTGDETWDKAMVAIDTEVKNVDIVALPNEQVADALYKQKAFKLLLGLITELHSDKSSLVEEVAKLRGTSVPAGGGSPVPVVTGPAVPANASFSDIARSKLDGVLPR